jgi:hypothetical protein
LLSKLEQNHWHSAFVRRLPKKNNLKPSSGYFKNLKCDGILKIADGVMSENRTRSARREKLDTILAQVRRGAISSSEAAKQMSAAGASMAVIGRLLQAKPVAGERQRGWTADGWFG